MSEERNYKAEVTFCSKDLSVKQKMMLKDGSNAIQLDKATQNGEVYIKPAYYGIVKIHNEKSKDRPDYYTYVIVDTDGAKYVTGSQSFWSAFSDIMDEIADSEENEEYAISVYRKPSKNYTGKDFITCSIV